MPQQAAPSIIAPEQRPLWRLLEPDIWGLAPARSDENPTQLILRTLLDQPRWLEVHHLYDEVGSRLFDRITELPEYYLTRTENSILAKRAGEIIAAASVEGIVELGAGNSKKTLHLLRDQARQRKGGVFAPIDVSLSSLVAARDSVRGQFPDIRFQGLCARYEDGFSVMDKGAPKLLAFLGSTVGNFSPPEFVRFFSHLSASMGENDYLLLGADRVKEVKILESAYNDSEGVTASFILNVFQNINRVSGSNFDLTKMRYRSWYNPERRRIEMYAVSTAAQEIFFPSEATSFRWEREEPILVEISRKFEPARLRDQLRCFGLAPIGHFTDASEWFSLLLFRKSSPGGSKKPETA